MATIKTQLVGDERRIITKEGRVSCSCCGACCMYPAQAFYDGLYTEEDLPDSITINPFDLGDVSVEVFRDGLIYGPYQFSENYSQQVTIREDVFGEPKWILEQAEINGILDDSSCLFFDFGPEIGGKGPAEITDTFAYTYTATTEQGTETLTRQSLCVWSGEENTLRFSATETFVGWLLNGEPKQGTMNTPVGNYESGSVS
jgi:hypothetical protein